MAFPSDLVRTKTWSTETLTASDLHGQLDLIINWVMAALNNTTGHDHSGSNKGKAITLAASGSGVTGVLPYANGGTGLSALGTAYQLLRMNSGASALEYSRIIKIVTTTRDMTTASGTQAVTGAGFTPLQAIVFAGLDATSAMSIGIDIDTSTHYSVWDQSNGSGGNWGISTTTSINLQTAGGVSQVGAFTTFSSDGGTITWTKSGAPTGTARLLIVFVG